MSESRFYATDPTNPDAPVVLAGYRGLRPGDRVTYTGSVPMTDEPVTVTELVRFGQSDYVSAVLADGEWEVCADNLKRVPGDDEGAPCGSCGATAVFCQRFFRDVDDWCCAPCRREGPQAMHRFPDGEALARAKARHPHNRDRHVDGAW